MLAEGPGFTCLGVGQKAIRFLHDLAVLGYMPGRIISYDQPDDQSKSFAKIKAFADGGGISFEENKRPSIGKREIAFTIGWQFMIHGEHDGLIVFHDSLLPAYRGFAPTVSALINGEKLIGVTALKPVAEVDAGPIYRQKSFNVDYPIKVAKAFDRQSAAMAELAAEILSNLPGHLPEPIPQDKSCATYSVWRDGDDYWLDWTEPVDRIVRTIDALGSPYEGARTRYEGEVIIIDEAETVPDLNFAIRQPGKVWALNNGAPLVICGQGIAAIHKARNTNGQPIVFNKIRRRFGT